MVKEDITLKIQQYFAENDMDNIVPTSLWEAMKAKGAFYGNCICGRKTKINWGKNLMHRLLHLKVNIKKLGAWKFINSFPKQETNLKSWKKKIYRDGCSIGETSVDPIFTNFNRSGEKNSFEALLCFQQATFREYEECLK